MLSTILPVGVGWNLLWHPGICFGIFMNTLPNCKDGNPPFLIPRMVGDGETMIARLEVRTGTDETRVINTVREQSQSEEFTRQHESTILHKSNITSLALVFSIVRLESWDITLSRILMISYKYALI